MEIMAKINQLSNEAEGSILAIVYFVLKKGTSFEIVLADIDAELQKEIANVFMASLEIILDNEEKEIVNLSTADNRKGAIYQYNLEEFPQALSLIQQSIPNETRKFDFRSDKFDEIFGFVIKIGLVNNNFSIFKKNYPISLVSKDKSLNLIRKRKHEFFTADCEISRHEIGIDIGSDQDDTVRIILAQLETAQREVLLLWSYGFTLSGIAAKTNFTVSQVRTLLAKARTTFLQKFSKFKEV